MHRDVQVAAGERRQASERRDPSPNIDERRGIFTQGIFIKYNFNVNK